MVSSVPSFSILFLFLFLSISLRTILCSSLSFSLDACPFVSMTFILFALSNILLLFCGILSSFSSFASLVFTLSVKVHLQNYEHAIVLCTTLLRPITKYFALFKLLSRKLVFYLINLTLHGNLWVCLYTERQRVAFICSQTHMYTKAEWMQAQTMIMTLYFNDIIINGQKCKMKMMVFDEMVKCYIEIYLFAYIATMAVTMLHSMRSLSGFIRSRAQMKSA